MKPTDTKDGHDTRETRLSQGMAPPRERDESLLNDCPLINIDRGGSGDRETSRPNARRDGGHAYGERCAVLLAQ